MTPSRIQGVESVAGPGIIVPQAVIYLQREPQRVGLLNGYVERKVVVCPLSALHPVQHELAPVAGLCVGRGVDAVVGHGTAGKGNRELGTGNWEVEGLGHCP